MPFELNPNPLLDFTGLTRFDAIKPAHVTPAIETLLAQCRATMAHVTADDVPSTWDAVAEPLDDATERLSRAWGVVAHLNAVVDTPELREQYNANVPKVTAFWTELSQNLELYAKYKRMAQAPDFADWPAARRKVVDNELRDFKLGGAELADAEKERLRRLRERLAQLSTRFAENVLDATNAFALYLDDPAQLAGVPGDTLQMYREQAAAEGKTGYKITLHAPSYFPILQYADDRALRERIYRAQVTRASEFGQTEWDNGAVMVEILKLRRELAQLLGYRDYAEVSLVPKMADSPREVIDFLRDLARRARPHAERDMAELRAFAAGELDLPELQPWDLAYASEKLRELRYAYSDIELKQYFPEPRVLAGLFSVIETLFGVAIREDRAPTWHPDVKFYRIESGGALIGQFYLDLYARDRKQGGAWQDDARNRRRKGDALQTPVSFLTCNFSRPIGGKPALFTHDEVLTLFHEFGHGLHHLLTRVDESAVAGIRGVEWDAVELPSQFMENWCYEPRTLRAISGHYESGEPLPEALADKLRAARHFRAGSQTLRQLGFGLTDLELHHQFDPAGAESAFDVERRVAQRTSVMPPLPEDRFLCSFNHVFAGGYAAGYYSYKWAEVLSADAFAAFEEAGLDDERALRAIGARFRDTVLALGASRPAMEVFQAFRGREPRVDALLRQSGLV